jgi:hypothetical protein
MSVSSTKQLHFTDNPDSSVVGTSAPKVQSAANTPAYIPDFRAIAKAHIERGFIVSATKYMSKEGMWGWNTLNLLFTFADVDRFLEKHPEFAHSNVAVVGSIGEHWKRDQNGTYVRDANGKRILEGNLLVLDIDTGGVVEQILRENPGKEFPQTYIVQSRPKEKPYKIHVYFRWTKYGIAAFDALAARFGLKTKEHMAIRDFTKPVDERGLHPNRYDLKGSGANGYVLGHGSVHSPDDGGEMYTAMPDKKDNPVLDQPPWLVDWFIQDLTKFYDEAEERSRQAAEHAEKVAALSPKKRAALQRKNDPEGFLISQEGTYGFLWAKAWFYARRGLPKESIRHFLLTYAPTVCHCGQAYVESEKGQRAIENIVKEVEVDDSESWLWRNKPDPKTKPDPADINAMNEVTYQRTRLLSIGQDFGTEISRDEMYQRFQLLSDDDADRKAAGRAMKELGYEYDKDTKVWRKKDA